MFAILNNNNNNNNDNNNNNNNNNNDNMGLRILNWISVHLGLIIVDLITKKKNKKINKMFQWGPN